jgi:RNA polymerase primary sigma factor
VKDYILINRCDTITKYFKDVNNTELLTIEEETELANKIQADGDELAIEKLVKSNLKFVVSIAKEYQGMGLALPDLISDGNLGLIKAATRFDPTRGFRFISYAVYWIKQSIMQSLNDNSRMIRLPSNIINKISKSYKDNKPLGSDDEIYPTCISLNTKLYGNSKEFEILDVLPDDSVDEFEILDRETLKLKDAINKSLSMLNDRERGIIECYYGINTHCEPMTLEAIGDKYHLTKERIRQIKEKAIRRLRHNNDELYSLINQ